MGALEDLKASRQDPGHRGQQRERRTTSSRTSATVGSTAIQERYNMLDRELEAELVPLCLAQDVSIMSYSSLALGLLSGKIAPDRVFTGDDQRATTRASPRRTGPGWPRRCDDSTRSAQSWA